LAYKCTRFRDGEGAFYVLYEYSCHDLENFVSIRELRETECSSFSLLIDVDPTCDQSAFVRKDLMCMVPLVETGQSAIETVVSILNCLGKNGIILYGLSVVA
jgi:hypothetical protein